MYLRFLTRLEFPQIAKRLCPDLTEDAIDRDSENVYEWMYIDLPQLGYSLNVSREHGWADLDDETLDQYENNNETLKQIVQPGPVYVIGWDRKHDQYVDALPDFLPSFFADRLAIDVAVFAGRLDVDNAVCEPLRVVHPNPNRQITNGCTGSVIRLSVRFALQ
jgi:hypothetical protein